MNKFRVLSNRTFLWSVLILLNLAVYWPALFHGPRADQFVYLMEMRGLENVSDIFCNSFSYPRTRVINPGDSILFRPLLYSFLSGELILFGVKFFYWQLTAIVCHLAVVSVLFGILLALCGSLPAFLLAGFFSVHVLSSEMVIWHHITGYMIAFVLMLAAVREAMTLAAAPVMDNKALAKIVLFVFLAALFYEFALCVGLLLTASLWMIKRKTASALRGRQVALLFVPLAAYLFCDMADMWGHSGIWADDKTFHPASFQILKDFINIFVLAVLTPLWPSTLPLRDYERLTLSGDNLVSMLFGGFSGGIAGCLNILCVVVLLVAAVWGWRMFAPGGFRGMSWAADRKLAAMTSAGCLLGYCLFLSVGRGMAYLQTGTYHFYILTGFGVMVLAAVIGGWPRKEMSFWSVIIVLSLCGLIALHAVRTLAMNHQRAEKAKPWLQYIASIDDFVHDHEAEEGFSFWILYSDYDLGMNCFTGLGRERKDMIAPTTIMIFQRYVDRRHPRYYLVCLWDRGLKYFTSREEAMNYLGRYHPEATSGR